MARAADTYMVYWIDNTVLERDMGKKKDERKRREREAERAASGGCGHEHDAKHDAKHDGAKHGRKHEGATPFAGIAAAVTRQLGTPAGRQVVAAGLMMVAAAITKQDAKTAGRAGHPAPPEPPVTPVTPVTPVSGRACLSGPRSSTDAADRPGGR